MCSFTRTLTSTSLVGHTYTLSATQLPAGAVSITPEVVTIAAGATADVVITIDGTTLASGWNFGALELVGDDILLPTLHMPIAVQP